MCVCVCLPVLLCDLKLSLMADRVRPCPPLLFKVQTAPVYEGLRLTGRATAIVMCGLECKQSCVFRLKHIQLSNMDSDIIINCIFPRTNLF